MLPNIELHPLRHNTPTYIITPSKEWHYLGFFFDPFLSFSSHIKRYSAKGLVTANNLKILGHSLGGIDLALRRHVYQAVVWSVMSYGLPLWYRINGKGCQVHLKLLNKTQNVALHWICGAFRTTLIAWMEFLAGVPPVKQKANYMLRNAVQRIFKVPISHVLHHIAQDLPLPNVPHNWQPLGIQCANIAILQTAIRDIPPMRLHDHATHIGNRLLDSTGRISVVIPAAPPRSSKVFQQWAIAWMDQNRSDLHDVTSVGSDGSYRIKGQGTSAFVIQRNNIMLHTHSFLVVAHSSFKAEMYAANAAIEYTSEYVHGLVLMFIDNQATLRSLFSMKPHTAFHTSLANCKAMAKWLSASQENCVEFRWLPSHLGFWLNELADTAVEHPPAGPPVLPCHSIVSRIRHNHSLVINEWRQHWQAFAASKELKLKKKKRPYMRNAWDGKGKQFIKLATDISLFSRFTRLILGHTPTGEYQLRFFPQEPCGCTCFEEFQSWSHLLVECPKYSSKFSSLTAFYKAHNNTKKIFRYLKENPDAFTFNDEPIDIYDPP